MSSIMNKVTGVMKQRRICSTAHTAISCICVRDSVCVFVCACLCVRVCVCMCVEGGGGGGGCACDQICKSSTPGKATKGSAKTQSSA